MALIDERTKQIHREIEQLEEDYRMGRKQRPYVPLQETAQERIERLEAEVKSGLNKLRRMRDEH